MTAALVPFDDSAERALVGAAVAWPDRIEAVADDLSPDAFHDVQLGLVWEAIVGLIVDGRESDPVIVSNRVRQLGGTTTAEELAALAVDAGPPWREHVEIVIRHHAAREALRSMAAARHSLAAGADPFTVAADTAARLDAVGARAGSGRQEAMTFPELIERAADAAPWAVPGLLRRDWRVVVVAPEGSGKSTLLRQLAICAGQGLHPFTSQRIDPVRALVVDAENPAAAIVETGAVLDEQVRGTVGNDYAPERCRVWSKPGGLDLREPSDRAAFVRELRAQRPSLVVAGPVYKLGRRHPGESYEDAAEGLLFVLDELRVRFGFALLLEHHAPKPQQGRREMLPFGSQRWLAWPEIGLGLVPDRDRPDTLRLDRFRGDRLRSWWPDRIKRGDMWPFVGVWDGGVPDLADYDRAPRRTRVTVLARNVEPGPVDGTCPECGAPPPRQGTFGTAICAHQAAALNGHDAPHEMGY